MDNIDAVEVDLDDNRNPGGNDPAPCEGGLNDLGTNLLKVGNHGCIIWPE